MWGNLTQQIRKEFLSIGLYLAENFTSIDKKRADQKKNFSAKTSDNDWPLPDTYFTSIGLTVRGFSFLFPNASAKLKEQLQPSKSLLNIESGTEETSNVITQNDFFPVQKEIKDKIDEYNGATTKYFVNESYFLYDESNLILDTCITALNKITLMYCSFSCFNGKTQGEKMTLIAAENLLKFLVEKDKIVES